MIISYSNIFDDCLIVVMSDDFERRTYAVSPNSSFESAKDLMTLRLSHNKIKTWSEVETALSSVGRVERIQENIEFMGDGNFSGGPSLQEMLGEN